MNLRQSRADRSRQNRATRSPARAVATAERDTSSHPHDTGTGDVGIECQLTTEPSADVPQHIVITDEGVGIHDRHRTAPAERIQPNDDAGVVVGSEVQLRAGPRPFFQSRYAADQQVRPEAPDVPVERGDCTVGRDQQREDVEAFGSVIRRQPRVIAGCLFDQRQRLGTLLWQPVHQHVPIRPERPLEAEEFVVPPRRPDPFRAADVNEAIAGDPVCPDHRC